MRIRIIKKITPSAVDTCLDRFRPGLYYEVDSVIATLFIAEGWAEEADLALPFVTASPGDQTHVAEWHSMTQTLHRERPLPSVEEAFAADVAFDDALAAAIERRPSKNSRPGSANGALAVECWKARPGRTSS